MTLSHTSEVDEAHHKKSKVKIHVNPLQGYDKVHTYLCTVYWQAVN